MIDAALLLLGIACAMLGGDWFVRGAAMLAQAARISPAIVGVTVVAFGTSAPELAVSFNAAASGTPEVSLGDVLGSNVANIALILGAAIALSPLRCTRASIRRDLSVALAAPILIGLLIADGRLSQLDGALMLTVFLAWLAAVYVEAAAQRGATVAVAPPWSRDMLLLIPGLALLIVAGRLIVLGALGIAETYEIDAFIVGATIVSIGTSVPELATVLVAKLRGHDDIGVGAILGSNIFNGLLIAGVTSVIAPIGVTPGDVGRVLGFGVVATLLIVPTAGGMVGRRRGLLLLALFLGYIAVTFSS